MRISGSLRSAGGSGAWDCTFLRADPTGDAEASALDRTRLGARALHAIELVWGHEAKRRQLLEPDACARLLRLRGVGMRSINEIERAVVAWGFEGLGGRHAPGSGRPKDWTQRRRLEAILRELGPKEMLLVLADLCDERGAASKQKFLRRSSGLRGARAKRAIAYYAMCREYFRQCAVGAPERS